VRHNSARNVDSEVLGRIARASLHHEGEVPGTIVGRSRVRGVRNCDKQACCSCAKQKLFHVIGERRRKSDKVLAARRKF
jgi:hypothetical protein